MATTNRSQGLNATAADLWQGVRAALSGHAGQLVDRFRRSRRHQAGLLLILLLLAAAGAWFWASRPIGPAAGSRLTPGNFPVYAGVEYVSGSSHVKGQERDIEVLMRSKDGPGRVEDFYRNRLVLAHWVPLSDHGGVIIARSQFKQEARIQVRADGTGSEIAVSIQEPVSFPGPGSPPPPG